MIFLVRHGETAGNASRVIQFPETALSPRGIAQAERLAERLALQGVARILASDYARAQMTALPVQRATGVPLELVPGLRERNFGDLRGTAYADLEVDPFAPGYTPPAARAGRISTPGSTRPGPGSVPQRRRRAATSWWSPTVSSATPWPSGTSTSRTA